MNDLSPDVSWRTDLQFFVTPRPAREPDRGLVVVGDTYYVLGHSQSSRLDTEHLISDCKGLGDLIDDLRSSIPKTLTAMPPIRQTEEFLEVTVDGSLYELGYNAQGGWVTISDGGSPGLPCTEAALRALEAALACNGS